MVMAPTPASSIGARGLSVPSAADGRQIWWSAEPGDDRLVGAPPDRAARSYTRIRLLPVNGADHFTILDALAQPEGVLMRALLAMLGR
jgi:hypothetical protein